jgi:hypothetical protein
MVRAQKKVSKGRRPNTPPESCCSVVTDPQVLVWSHMWPGPQPNAISKNSYSRRSSHTKPNRINQRLWAFGVPWSPGFTSGLPPRDGFWTQSKWPCNMTHSMPRRNPHGLYIHLAHSHTPVGSSSVDTWSEFGPSPPFPPTRVLEA